MAPALQKQAAVGFSPLKNRQSSIVPPFKKNTAPAFRLTLYHSCYTFKSNESRKVGFWDGFWPERSIPCGDPGSAYADAITPRRGITMLDLEGEAGNVIAGAGCRGQGLKAAAGR